MAHHEIQANDGVQVNATTTGAAAGRPRPAGLDRMPPVTTTHTRTETHEERFVRLLSEAIDAGNNIRYGISPIKRIQKTPGPRASRENAVAMTELETALLWAKRDMEIKGDGDGGLAKQPTG